MSKVQVIGGGAWGLALARRLVLNGHQVRLWRRSGPAMEVLRARREDPRLLPGVLLPEPVELEDDPWTDPDFVVYAVPSQGLREAAGRWTFPARTVRISVVKGIEHGTLMRMSEVIQDAAPGGPVAALSGPSHAEEVGRDLPASVVAACGREDVAEAVQQLFFAPVFRVYRSDDIVGVELGGALKNVIAIAAGVCDGLELGDSAKAGLMTRGLAEMARLGTACGAHPITFAGLSGMGDLIVTCSSRHSRNRAVGEALGRGRTLMEILASTPKVAEGIRTAPAARGLAATHQIEMPITEMVCRVLEGEITPLLAMEALLERTAKSERR